MSLDDIIRSLGGWFGYAKQGNTFGLRKKTIKEIWFIGKIKV